MHGHRAGSGHRARDGRSISRRCCRGKCDNPAIEAEALQIFKRMADYLAAAKAFSYHSESSYDVVQASGMKVEFGASRNVLVSRPNQLRMDSERRDGMRGELIFDGQTIWAVDPDENVYATADAARRTWMKPLISSWSSCASRRQWPICWSRICTRGSRQN